MSQLPQYLQSAVKDNAISLAQAELAAAGADQLPAGPADRAGSGNPADNTPASTCTLMDSSKMTQH